MPTEEEIYDEPSQIAESDSSFAETALGYLKYWKWFLLSLIVFMGFGYFYVKSQEPQFRIQSELLIKDNRQITNQVVLTELNVSPPPIAIDNEILILKSNTLVETVVKKLGLQTSYYIKGHLNKRILYNNSPIDIELIKASAATYTKDWIIQVTPQKNVEFNGKKVLLNTPISTEAGVILVKPLDLSLTLEPIHVDFNTVTDVAKDYSAKLNVIQANKSSNVLNVSTEDAVPQRGIDFLNNVVDEYNTAAIKEKNKSISNTIAFIDERLGKLAVDLGDENQNVQNFKSNNNIIDLSAQSSTLLDKVSENDTQIASLDLQLDILKNIERFLASPDNVEVNQPSMLGLTDATLTTQVAALGDLKLKKQSLLRTTQENNPVVGEINDQILSLKKSLVLTVKTVRSNLILSKRQLQNQNGSYQSNLKQFPVKERELFDVMRNQGVKNTLFSFLLQKREETQLTLASNIGDSRVINQARSSGTPVKPVATTLYMLFFTMGLGIPFGIIFLKDMLNNTVRRKSDITKGTRVPVIAQISHSDDLSPLTIISKPRSIVAEQLRSLRTNLEFLIPGQGSKTILFTSTVSGEGKSFISLNLGASLASTGKKVIILELDLRKPKLLSTIGLEKKIGLSDYLIGKVTYQEIIRAVPQQENFFMIESGTIPPNPAEILMSKYLTDLITALRSEFDYILIDAPPVGLVTDAQILSQFADVTFFLVRHNVTRKDHITLLNEMFLKKVFKNLNIVFNSIDVSSLGYGYRYDYSYYQMDEPGSDGFVRSIFKRFKN